MTLIAAAEWFHLVGMLIVLLMLLVAAGSDWDDWE